jgi:hypothetical protein
VHQLDLLDLVGIALGILFTLAKLETQGRHSADCPQVKAADFERWQRLTSSLYGTGAAICFARVLFHQGFAYYVGKLELSGPALPKTLLLPALLVDAVFVAGVALTFVRAARARALRRELGIVLAPAGAAPTSKSGAAARDQSADSSSES